MKLYLRVRSYTLELQILLIMEIETDTYVGNFLAFSDSHEISPRFRSSRVFGVLHDRLWM
jgi:hypothetical protein